MILMLNLINELVLVIDVHYGLGLTKIFCFLIFSFNLLATSDSKFVIGLVNVF